MIRRFGLEGFRCFGQRQSIDLRPITVLTGGNSSGKTSILHSLLLLKQTLEVTATIDQRMELSGRYVQYDGFQQLVNVGQFPGGLSYHFDLALSHEESPTLGPLVGAASISLEENIPSQGNVDSHRPVRVSRLRLTSQTSDGRVIGIDWDNDREHPQFRFEGFELGGMQFRTMKLRNFLPIEIEGEPPPGELMCDSLLLPQPLMLVVDDLDSQLSKKLRFIGPLRIPPQRIYSYNISSLPNYLDPEMKPGELGKWGEFAPQILWRNRDTPVDYVTNHGTLQRLPLASALQEALRDLGVEYDVSVEPNSQGPRPDINQASFGIMFKTGDNKHSIADVGFGLSQVLPIVIMGLLSPRGSLLLFEQPEIHLHPQLQANLADFFLKLDRIGKRVLVETHSEHLIHRLLRRCAESADGTLADRVNISIVRKGEPGQGSQIERLQVNEFGNIVNWPNDFFSDSGNDREAKLRANIEKQRRRG